MFIRETHNQTMLETKGTYTNFLSTVSDLTGQQIVLAKTAVSERQAQKNHEEYRNGIIAGTIGYFQTETDDGA